MITITGWTWEYIDEYMTLPRLKSLNNYWAEHPPIHLIAAGFVGYKPKKKLSADENFNELMNVFSQAGGKVVK